MWKKVKYGIKKVELNHNMSSVHSMRPVEFLWRAVRVAPCWDLLCLKKGYIYDTLAVFKFCEFSTEG